MRNAAEMKKCDSDRVQILIFTQRNTKLDDIDLHLKAFYLTALIALDVVVVW